MLLENIPSLLLYISIGAAVGVTLALSALMMLRALRVLNTLLRQSMQEAIAVTRAIFVAIKAASILYRQGSYSALESVSYIMIFYRVAKSSVQGNDRAIEVATALARLNNDRRTCATAAQIITHPYDQSIKNTQESILVNQDNPVLLAGFIIDLRRRFGYFFVNQTALVCLARASAYNLLESFVAGVYLLKAHDQTWSGFNELLEERNKSNALITPDFFEQRAREIIRENPRLNQNPQDNHREPAREPVIRFQRQQNLQLQPFVREREESFVGVSFATVMQTLPENYRHNGGALVTAIDQVLRNFESEESATPQEQRQAFRRELHYIASLLRTEPAHVIWMNDIAANASAGCENASRLGLNEIFAWIQVARKNSIDEKIAACQYVKLVHMAREHAQNLFRNNTIPGIYIPEVAGALLYQSYVLLQRQNRNLSWLGLYSHSSNTALDWMAPFNNMTIDRFMTTHVAQNLCQRFAQQITQSTFDDLKEFFISCASVSSIIMSPDYYTECLAGAAAGKNIADAALTVAICEPNALLLAFQDLDLRESINLRDFLKENVLLQDLHERIQRRFQQGAISPALLRQLNDFLECNDIRLLTTITQLFAGSEGENEIYQCIRPDAIQAITSYRQDRDNAIRDLVHEFFMSNINPRSGFSAHRAVV